MLATLRHTGATPVLDVAYYGLAETLEDDLKVVRNAFAQSDRCIAALSCSKAFGLYRDRVGVLLVCCASRDEAQRVSSRLGALSRLLVSGAPAHGAEAVARILADQDRTRVWREELEEMRLRLAGLRRRLAQRAPDLLGTVADQRGIFAMLPLNGHQVQRLASHYGIYLAPSGRANLAGLRSGDVERFVDALCRVRASEG